MPFTRVGPNDYVSPSGRHWTAAQVRLYHATGGFKRKKKRKTREVGMLERLSFADVVAEERALLEVNHCHGPGRGHPCMGVGDAFQGGRLGSTAPRSLARSRGTPLPEHPDIAARRKRDEALARVQGGRPATGARAQISADWRTAMTNVGLRTDRPGRASAAEGPYSAEEQAQRSPTFGGTKLGFQLSHAVTAFDQRQSRRPGYNRYALPQYLAAATRVQDEVKRGTPIRKAIVNNFTGRLLDHVLKAVGLPKSTREEQR